jgi:hypothetical protein
MKNQVFISKEEAVKIVNTLAASPRHNGYYLAEDSEGNLSLEHSSFEAPENSYSLDTLFLAVRYSSPGHSFQYIKGEYDWETEADTEEREEEEKEVIDWESDLIVESNYNWHLAQSELESIEAEQRDRYND